MTRYVEMSIWCLAYHVQMLKCLRYIYPLWHGITARRLEVIFHWMYLCISFLGSWFRWWYSTELHTEQLQWLKFTSKPRFAVTNKKWQIYMSCLLLSTENILSTLGISLRTVRVSSGGKGGGMKGRSWLVQGRSGGHVNLLSLRLTTRSHANTHIQYPQETPDCECMQRNSHSHTKMSLYTCTVHSLVCRNILVVAPVWKP